MKKSFMTLFCLLLASVFLLLLCSCSDGKFFSKSALTSNGIPDLPRFESERTEALTGRRVFRYGATEEEYNAYAAKVYEYLQSCNFQYLGSRGEGKKDNGSAVTDYALTQCGQLSDFICKEYTLFGKESGEYYVFIWARELKEGNFLAGPRYLEIRYSSKDQTMELRLTPVLENYYIKATYEK